MIMYLCLLAGILVLLFIVFPLLKTLKLYIFIYIYFPISCISLAAARNKKRLKEPFKYSYLTNFVYFFHLCGLIVKSDKVEAKCRNEHGWLEMVDQGVLM